MSHTAPPPEVLAENAIGLTRLPSSAFLVSTVPVIGALIVQLSTRHWAWDSRAVGRRHVGRGGRPTRPRPP